MVYPATPICSMFKRQCRENWLLPKELPIEITDHVLCLSFEWDWYNFFTKPSIGIQYFVVHCFRRAQLLPLSWVELHAIERQTVISATSVIFMQPPNHLSSEPLCSCHITEIILHASPLHCKVTVGVHRRFDSNSWQNVIEQHCAPVQPDIIGCGQPH